MPSIYQAAHELGKEVNSQIFANICMTEFEVTNTQHAKIMEILGVRNNQLKKDFFNYKIKVMNNGHRLLPNKCKEV